MNFRTSGTVRTGLIAALTAALLMAVILPAVPGASRAAAAETETVYDEELHPLYADYSWADVDLGYAGDAYSGTASIRMEPDYGKAMYLYRDRVLRATDYDRFEMRVRGEGSGGQQVKLVFQGGGVPLSEWKLHELLPNGIPGGEWAQVVIPAGLISPDSGLVDTIILADESGADQPALLVDLMRFIGEGAGNRPGDPQEAPGEEGPNEAPQEPAGEESGEQPQQPEGEEPGGQPQEPAGEVVPPEEADGIVFYQEGLGADIQDFGWADHSLDHSRTVHTGQFAIRMEPDYGGAIYLYSGVPIQGKDYTAFEMWVHGGETGGQQLKLSVLSGGAPVAERSVSELLPEGIAAGEWRKVEATLESLGLSEAVFDAIVVADASGGDQAAVYLDDLVLRAKEVIPPALIEARMEMHQLLLLPGERQQLVLTAFYADGTDRDVSAEAVWSTDRPEIVSVHNGIVQGLSYGIAQVTATLGEATAAAYVQVTEVEEVPVYRDGMQEGFSDWSWHEKNLKDEMTVHEGVYSIEFEPSGWDGVWLHGEEERKFGDYYGIRFWVHGGDAGGQQLLVHIYDGYSHAGAVELNDHLPGGALAAGEWRQVTLNLADFGISDGSFTGVVFQAGTENEQPTVFLDDVSFLKNSRPNVLPQPELPAIAVNIDTTQNRRPIDKHIYGINYDDNNPTDSRLPFPVVRWGGNNTTRYNWKLDVTNRAEDWYFMNIPYYNEGTTETDKLIDQVTASGGQVLLTIPTIGWTAKDREVRWSYSVDKFGEQRATAPGYPDAGNGIRPDGTHIEGADPEDTSVRVGPEFAVEWIEHLQNNGDRVNFYALDNEPEIWHVTHRDIHPEPPTYDEIWSFTEEYGAAIKRQDPDAQIFGPTSWGWCAYFYSSADQCADGPDRQAHGGKPFLQWYLEKVREFEEHSGVRLVDYLDIHFYPQENGIAGDNESSYVAKRRFQSLKSLYDPNFVDQSWISEPIRLIPRMKEWIEEYNPGMKLAITEYNFGNGTGITAGLAQAEALAIFGREGVDLATRFGNFRAGTPIEDAFKLYLDYDGRGSSLDGTSVAASSSNVNAVGAYAIEGMNGELYALLFNKDTIARKTEIAADRALHAEPEVYRFTSERRLGAADAAIERTEEGIALMLPARSATLLVWK